MAALASSVLQSPLQIRTSDSSFGSLFSSRIHRIAPSFNLKCSRRQSLFSGDGGSRRNLSLKSVSADVYSDPSSPPSVVDEYKAKSELLASLKIKLLVGLSFNVSIS